MNLWFKNKKCALSSTSMNLILSNQALRINVPSKLSLHSKLTQICSTTFNLLHRLMRFLLIWGSIKIFQIHMCFEAKLISNNVDLEQLRGGADKSLARPGRKQATATKLGIYSKYSPRSSIHFLTRCSNFYKSLKKKPEGCSSNEFSASAMTSASDEKWRSFNCFSVQGTGGSSTGPDPENRVGDKDNRSPSRPVSSGL